MTTAKDNAITRFCRRLMLAAIALLTLAVATPAAHAQQGTEVRIDPRSMEQARILLLQVEERMNKVNTLSAKIVYDRIQGLLGDAQRRFGTINYAPGPPARFAIHFNQLLVDDRMEKQDRHYIFDGRWLLERIGDKKQYIKRQVVPPDADPAKVDPLGSGKGPFVLPLTGKTDQVLSRYFAVLVKRVTRLDPPNSFHIQLIPRLRDRRDFVEVHLWYDQASLLPIKVRTLDDSENESIFYLRELRVDAPLPRTAFSTDIPRDPGWQGEIKPYREDE